MYLIPNYRLESFLGESPQARVYSGYYIHVPTRKLVIKVLKSNVVSDSAQRYFRQKIEHLKILNDDDLVVPLSYQESLDVKFITRKYVPGQTLSDWLATKDGITIPDFFAIAFQLASLLEKIHQGGIVHGGIKPHNILVEPETLKISIIDFITPFDVRNISHFIYDQDFIRNTLCYTSPEQTGRINHRVEFTTDIYSLGVVFHELLTRKLPFESQDPLSVIHSHLAEASQLISSNHPLVPEMLSRIVEKMLLKQPEKRYQRGFGLLADLEKVKAICDRGQFGSLFQLGLDDRSHRVTFISKMVGRDAEAQAILNEYAAVTKGSFRSMFISGLSGIGKTRLIQELQTPIVKNRGYFTSGKFDVYQKNVPYSSLTQAFRNLIRTFLTESDERVRQWKEKIQAALGANGSLVTDIIPELTVLIGPQPPVPQLSPVEARNRFNLVFGNFLSSIAGKDSPLVLFIDDLQWCDLASFEFLTNIFLNQDEHKYLFLMGAFRHNEVDPSHPLLKMMSFARQNNIPIEEIRLGPIADRYTHEMVSYILDAPDYQTMDLGMFLHDLTEGNPLFVSESLSYLYNEQLLYFNSDASQWKWSIDKIRDSKMPSTVVGLFSTKVQKLPTGTIELLEFCACLGNLFTPMELGVIKDIPLVQIYELLRPALGQGLLIENKDQLQFVHDKVQEATLVRIDSPRRQTIHWEIGHHLYRDVAPDADFEKIENIFKITSHLNLGYTIGKSIGTLMTPDDKKLLSRLNFSAGNAALNSLATDSANEYFLLSKELLSENCWDDNYEHTYRVYQKAAKTELMVGRYENSERLLNHLLRNARTDLDKAEALAEQTTSLSSIGNFISAIETANKGLAFFGKEIPDDPKVAKEKCQKILAEIHSSNQDVWQKIASMPFTMDRQSKVELAFYSELIPDLYMSGLVEKLYLSAAQSTLHCLNGGMDESVIYSFSIMGLNLGEQEHFEYAYRYEDLAKDLCEKYPNTFGATRGMNGVVWCNMHSRSHPTEIIAYCQKSIQCGKNCGDLYNAGLSYGPLMWNLQVRGTNFRELETFVTECFDFSKKFQLSFSVGLAEAMRAGWVEPMKCDGAVIDMTEKIRQWEQVNHIASIASYYFHFALTSYYFGDYIKAEEGIENVRTYLRGLTDNVLKRQWYVLQILNDIKAFELRGKFASKDDLIAHLKPLLEKVEKWSTLGPLLRPYLSFAIAECQRITVGVDHAINYYFTALRESHAAGYTFLEGFIYEKLTELHAVTNPSVAAVFMTNALKLYQECGADRKLFTVSETFANLVPERDFLPLNETSKQPDRDHRDSTDAIDEFVFIRASQAISAEMGRDSLLAKVVETFTKAFGAQYGVIALFENGELGIARESKKRSRVSSPGERQGQQISARDLDSDLQGLLRYVSRTKSLVLLNNKNLSEVIPDLAGPSEPKSILCLPVMAKHSLLAIVYLENKLSNASFTERDVELLGLLCSQTAISLENARLYEELQKDNEYRKEIEAKLIAAKNEADLANSAKSQFLANMSHEIRTPLHSIIGVTEILMSSSSSPAQEKLLKVAHAAGESLLCIVNDILDISRIEVGAIALESIPFSLREQLQICAEIIGINATKKSMTVSMWVDPTVSDHRRGDPTRIRQILFNLLSNAVKFSNGGEVVLKISHARNDDMNSPLVFSIADQGIGIADDQQNAIFETFRQLDPTVTRRFGGSGLGLPISKKLVELMNGRLWVESKLGKGSTFYFTVDVPEALAIGELGRTGGLSRLGTSTHAKGDSGDLPPGAKSVRILLADDSEENQLLFSEVMTFSGYEIKCVSNGLEAFEICKYEPFDLIFMDVQMPIMDGYSATRKIRHWEQATGKGRTPIVAFTAHAFDESIRESLAAGCDLHISKPFKMEALFDIIASYCQSNQGQTATKVDKTHSDRRGNS